MPVHRQPTALLLALTLGLSCLPRAGAQAPVDLSLPDMGESARSALSAERERRLGEAFMRNLRRSLPIVQDPLVAAYIESLGLRLASQSDDHTRQYHFFVVDDPQINAFAGPGGYIGVNAGLILAAQSESEVAAVIAHEIAHVTQHHIARSVEQAQHLSIPTAAAILASLVLATQNSELGQAAMAAASAGSTQAQINFIRDNEKEADRVGIRILHRSGFDPRSMPSFFERLQFSNRFQGDPAPEFLRTHPVTRSRIADSRNRAEQYAYRQYPDSEAFELIRARLRVLEHDGSAAQLVSDFQEALRSGQYRKEAAARYGYALALLEAGRVEQARAALAPLLADRPQSIALRLAAARADHAAGHTAQALQGLEEALALYPNNGPLTEAYAELLLQAGRPQQARDLLHAYRREREPGPRLFRLLSRAQSESGNGAEAHEAMAEAHFLEGDTHGAITQLEIAQRGGKLDFYQSSRIQARLEVLKELAKEEDKP